MTEYDHLSRDELISLVRKLNADQGPERSPASRDPDEFPVFGDQQQRQFDASPHPMRISEHGTWKYLAVNDAALELYGYTREEFLRLSLRDTRYSDEHAKQAATFVAHTGCLRHSGTRRHVKKSGEIIFVEVITQDVFFNGRQARLSLAIDITERKKREDELRRQQELLDAVLDNLPVGVFIKDAKTFRYIMRNSFSKRVFGTLKADHVGKNVYELFPQEQADRFNETDREAVATRRMLEIPQQEVMGIAGNRRIQHVRKVPLYDETGRPWVIVGIADDITERKRAESALRESNEFLRSVIESSRDCIKVLDLDGCLEWISAGGQRLMEIDDADSLLQKSYLDFWSGADREAASHALASARAGDASRFEGYCPTYAGTPKWWDEIATPILGADGRPAKLLVLSRDITESKLAEERRIADVIRQRDALVREVHHRIKNSLQGVVGLLRSKIKSKPATAQDIKAAIAQIQSIALVYGLQSKPSGGAIALAEILEAICDSVGNLAGGFIDRQYRRESESATFLAENEAVPVAVALNELIFNGLKHSQATRGERRIRVALSRQAQVAIVTMTNRGALPAEFDFSSGRRVGVGLDLVRTLLLPKGSKLAFRSGRGAVEVTLELRPPLIVVQKISAVA